MQRLTGEELIDDVNSDEERLWMQFVLEMHIDEPVEQHHAHVLGNVLLLLEVVVVDGSGTHLA